ncbi:MAG: RtcB family protein, partial [Anaerolineaceae bacterium]|nr:RtcB family protein [Anaerolineaceae bacterium]
MDINSVLKQYGYGSRMDFPAIAKWAAARRGLFHTETELLKAVGAEFGYTEQKIGMRARPMPYRLWMHPETPVDSNAIDQLKTALSLPVAVGGAGMPDLHKGYSLPIGGVVVLDHAISPAFVGYDISCMMMLTIVETGSANQPEKLEKEKVRVKFLDWVLASTSFGIGSETHGVDHPVMDSPVWKESSYLRGLKGLAAAQLGSSGAGNHFADIVVGQYKDGEDFVELLTHSGSRGVGNKVGHHFSALADRAAVQKYKFPSGYGWFDLDSESGQEYKAVMELMGDYARANHEIIHQRFLEVSGLGRKVMYSNKHNFAWVDPNGQVYHRKGATPANEGQYGIIPGSSGSASYLVVGKGNPESWYSASHGAGRLYSRTEARRRYDARDFARHMREKGITYHGVAPDETINAYKDIDKVIEAQSDL